MAGASLDRIAPVRDDRGMAKRPRRTSADPNEHAFLVVRESVGPDPVDKTDAAGALSRLGAKKGGEARAKALSGRRRRAIAKKAAAARWKNKRKGRGDTAK